MPAEAEEDRDRRPELGEELAAAGPQPLVDRGQQPRPDEVLGQRRRLVAGLRLDVDEQAAEDARRSGRSRRPSRSSPSATRSPRRLDGRRVEHDLALLGVVLGLGQVVDQPAGQDVDELDVRVADHEPAGVADGDRDLHRELDRRRRRA